MNYNTIRSNIILVKFATSLPSFSFNWHAWVSWWYEWHRKMRILILTCLVIFVSIFQTFVIVQTWSYFFIAFFPLSFSFEVYFDEVYILEVLTVVSYFTLGTVAWTSWHRHRLLFQEIFGEKDLSPSYALCTVQEINVRK